MFKFARLSNEAKATRV